MSEPRELRLHLDDEMRERAQAGELGIANRIRAAFESRDFRVEFVSDSAENRLSALPGTGYHLFHLQEAMGPNTLVLRLAYYYPFWRIEESNARWQFDVAHATFDPETIDPETARAFVARRRRKLFGARRPENKGFILIPLQGRLTEHRSFQSMSPLDMIRATRAADPEREILLRRHPGESYSREEMTALRQLIDTTPGVRLATRPTLALLAECDYVVTQNSSVALAGFFLEKPAVLFARIDFHHIVASVPEIGIAAAFRAVRGPAPDYTRYLWWFLRETTIDATAEDAETRILARARRFGWPV
ncbi:hypothetical protein [Acidimangrovimonas pyrenivorans]|uniref:Capsule polysaccharide biosynthesis protein n=1 Tax=Acidimangrovimonas pyrenivorans TaxID=2030798 RepID=A0ABV7AMG9_9RHOB